MVVIVTSSTLHAGHRSSSNPGGQYASQFSGAPKSSACGARVIARAWVDSAYKKRLLADGHHDCEFGFSDARAKTWWCSRTRSIQEVS
jgi:Nitrile hydratase, alpha chain